MDMSCNAYLTAEHTPFAYFGRSCNAHLRCHNGVCTDFVIVGYLYQVVQFHTFVYDGCTHCSTVHASVCAYLYIVFQYYDTDLRYFFVTFGSWSETKTIRTDHTAGM